MNVKAGDYILAVNGTPVSTLPNINEALIGTADKQVILRVNSKPSDDGARDVTVVPIADESPLYYLDWVQRSGYAMLGLIVAWYAFDRIFGAIFMAALAVLYPGVRYG